MNLIRRLISSLKIRRQRKTVILGDRLVTVYPMDLETYLETVNLLLPYLVLYEQMTSQLATVDNQYLIFRVIKETHDQMSTFPGDVTRLLANLTGLEPVWIAKNVKPDEIFLALPTLDEVHRFGQMIEHTLNWREYAAHDTNT